MVPVVEVMVPSKLLYQKIKVNKMIRLNFETVTPLHISNGNQLAYNLEYIIVDGSVAKLNGNKSSKALAKAEVFDFNKNYKFFEIIKLIEKNKHIFDNNSFDYKVYAIEAFTDFLSGEKRDGQKIIQEFINVNGNFYIPGSSIKGMLTTIMNRNPDKNPIGINPQKPSIADKFVITDSDYLDPEDIVVDRVNRPPEINIMTLDPGVKFTSTIRNKGNLDLDMLRRNLMEYSSDQMDKARIFVRKYKDFEKKPGGATYYNQILDKMVTEMDFGDDCYFVNLGFGGGSYYKLFPNAKIPKFRNPGRKGKLEEAHTTFSVNIDGNPYQLGWCKLKIEED